MTLEVAVTVESDDRNDTNNNDKESERGELLTEIRMSLSIFRNCYMSEVLHQVYDPNEVSSALCRVSPGRRRGLRRVHPYIQELWSVRG